MSFDYSNMVTTARAMLERFGRTVTVRTIGEGIYDAQTDTFTGGGQSDVSVKAVFLNYKDSNFEDTSIQRGDKLCLIADINTPPQTNETIIDGTDQWKVINIQTVEPGDAKILYKLQVRK